MELNETEKIKLYAIYLAKKEVTALEISRNYTALKSLVKKNLIEISGAKNKVDTLGSISSTPSYTFTRLEKASSVGVPSELTQ